MKKVIVILVLVALILMLCGCESIDQMMHPGKTKVAGVWVDRAAMEKFDFTNTNKEITATLNGDTYCGNCDKYTAGRVRICSFCGQYVS